MTHTYENYYDNYIVDADALYQVSVNDQTLVSPNSGALGVTLSPKMAAKGTPERVKCENGQLQGGSMQDQNRPETLRMRTVKVAEVLCDPVHKLAYVTDRRKEFRLKNGLLIAPHPHPSTIKQALAPLPMPVQQPQMAAVPVAQAQQQIIRHYSL